MVSFPYLLLIFCCLFVFGLGLSTKTRNERAAAGGWGYTNTNGPSTWGGTCKTGQMQSPINIQLGTVTVKYLPPFIFDNDYLSKQKFNAKNNGHTIQVTLDDDSVRPKIQGGGLGSEFIFEQLHMHWESEHEFDGKRADMEMHIVHYNSKYKSFAEASKKPDGIAVLAVIFDQSNTTNDSLEKFFSYILESSASGEQPPYPAPPNNYLPEEEEEEDPENSELFSLRDLLPNQVSRFFRYNGSLTTPGCGEVVQWTIFINRLNIPSRVLKALKELRDHDGNKLTQNFRPPQSLNGREVVLQIISFDGLLDPKLEKMINYSNELQEGAYNSGNRKTKFSLYLLGLLFYFLV